MRNFFIIIISFFLFGKNEIVVGQETNYFPKQFLVQLKPQQSVQNLHEQLNRQFSTVQWIEPQRLIPDMNYFLLEYQENGNDAMILEFLKSSPIIQTAQYNHKITLRSPNNTAPNDASYASQWQYKNIGGAIGGVAGVDLDAELAWDITTGGMTALNDTIVIAILDNGISSSQADFGDNLWRNRSEIPSNHIDDDHNGYEDDYLGWNSNSNTDNINGGGHGTSVAGIIGAQGNNSIGVTGVNWNVKMMIIHNNWNTSEALVLAAYGYALTQRRIYNKTNGQSGAYVVATNASWGLDGGQPSNAPLWCAFYDTLGAAGILNIAATANQNVNVDTYGDLPTACPSDYLVAVTNVNKLGNKVLGAAYGNTTIDLGSFGDGVYTTISPSGYGTFGGTSGASPHVAGAVGILYAGACSNFIAYSRIHPDSAALKMKAYLLNGVVPIADLAGKTVSGGYMNLFNSLNNCINDCPSQGCFAPYQVRTTNLLDTQAQVQFNWTPSVQQVKYAYREQGGIWSSTSTLPLNQKSVVLHNLVACTDYEVLLISVCNGSNGDSILFNFKTNGCCEAPQNLNYDIINADSIHLTWQPLLASNYYMLQYKEVSASVWQNISNITTTNFWLENLNPCTYYDIKIQAVCQNGDTTPMSNVFRLPTLGCQDCNILDYCLGYGANSAQDYIDSFWVDNFVIGSGNNGGYALFGSSGILLNKGDYHNVWVRQGGTYNEQVKIWLDINQDGDFADLDENIFTAMMAYGPPLYKLYKGSFIVPATTYLGTTRMRVAMRWNNAPNNCGTIDYGEVEDYCVQIIPGTSTTQLANDVFDMVVFPNPYEEAFQVQIELKKDTDLDFSIFSSAGQLVYSQQTGFQSSGKHLFSLQPNLPAGVYFLKVQTKEGQMVQLIVNN